MIRLLKIAGLACFFLSLTCFHAKANEWKISASYHHATKAVKADTRIFVLASGNLYSYDTEDETVETYDKTNYLSDFGIHDIAYSSYSKTLVILYENGNIDLLGMDGETWNMPDMKNKAIDDKTLNELKVVDNEALISLGSGLVLIDIDKAYYVDYYALGSKVSNATIQGGKIYANTASGVMEGDRTLNLLDLSNWKTLSSSTITFGQTAEEKAAEEALLEQVAKIVPDSPIRNVA